MRRPGGLMVAAVLAALSLLGRPALCAAKPAKRTAAAHTAARKAPAAQSTQAKERAPSPPAAATSESKGESGSDSDDAAPAAATPTTNASGGKVKTKAYSFGAMDVEGKLKTPQLLYFLNRVKLELDMSAPDKRSFMKELQQSADDKNL